MPGIIDPGLINPIQLCDGGKVSAKALRIHCRQCKVRHQTLFQNLPSAYLDETDRLRDSEQRYSTHQLLYLENVQPTHFYSLYSGWVALYKTLGDGRRQIFKYALPGDWLGFVRAPDGTANHSAEAITDVQACAFSVCNLDTLIARLPEIAMQLAEMTAHDMSMCEQHLLCTSKKDARARLAYFFLETFYRVRHQAPSEYSANTHSINFPLTQEHIGDTLGLTNVHVSRMLKQLKVDGLIDCQQRRMTILDEARLAEIAEIDPAAIIRH